MASVIAQLTERFVAGFPERTPTARTVGREAEFPVVDAQGRGVDASGLWSLLERPGRTVTHDVGLDGDRIATGIDAGAWVGVIEVGRCTVEVSAGPRDTLHELAGDLDAGLDAVSAAATRLGGRLLGLGTHPVTPGRAELLTPKARYGALLDAIGEQWLVFARTAGDQVQIDVGRDELVSVMNTMHAMSGPMIALCANSAVHDGGPASHACGREHLAAGIAGEPSRHGAPPRAFADAEEYVAFLAGLRCLCLPDGEGGFVPVGRPFIDHLRETRALHDPDAAFEAFRFHEHYIWPSARPRSHIGTIELRPACQQPSEASWAPTALGLGLVESAADADALLRACFGADPWPAAMRYREQAVARGAAVTDPAPGFLRQVLDVAAAGLRRRGHGEEVLLEPLAERIERRRGPADESRELVTRSGMPALVERFAIAPRRRDPSHARGG